MDFIADYLFRDDTGVVSRALDASKTDAYVSGQFITLHDPGVLVVTVGGDAAKAAKQRVLNELAKLEKPMDRPRSGGAGSVSLSPCLRYADAAAAGGQSGLVRRRGQRYVRAG